MAMSKYVAKACSVRLRDPPAPPIRGESGLEPMVVGPGPQVEMCRVGGLGEVGLEVEGFNAGVCRLLSLKEEKRKGTCGID